MVSNAGGCDATPALLARLGLSDSRAELVDVDSSDLQRAWYTAVLRGEHAVEQVAGVDPALTAIDGDRQSALERELG